MENDLAQFLKLEFPYAGFDAICREKATKAVKEWLNQNREKTGFQLWSEIK